jgi:hypothetical protein
MKTNLPEFCSTLFQALAATGLMLVMVSTASAELKWTKPNSPSTETLALLPLDGSLDSSTEKPNQAQFTQYSSDSDGGIARNPAEPEFSEGPSSLGKALKLNPDNLLLLGGFKSHTPLALTVSFWVKISDAGFLCSIQNSGVPEEELCKIGLKVNQDGRLVIQARLGLSKWTNEVVPSNLLTDTWQHVAVVVAPDENGTASNLTISVDGEVLWDSQVDGVGPEHFLVTLGLSPYEYTLPQGGPGAQCEVDEVLVVEKALPDPHKPL